MFNREWIIFTLDNTKTDSRNSQVLHGFTMFYHVLWLLTVLNPFQGEPFPLSNLGGERLDGLHEIFQGDAFT